MEADEKQEFLSEMGQDEAGLDRLIKAGYHLLGLQTYFTAGVQEVRAWTISCIIYSLPSARNFPASFAPFSPLHSIKSSKATVSARIKPFSKSP
jgi:hypothetical protein